MAATMPGLKERGLRMERPGAAGQRATNAGATGGRSKCMSGRQSVRTRRRVDKSDNSWGHAASRKVHPRAERRAQYLLPWPSREPLAFSDSLDRVLRKDTHAVYGQGARLPRVLNVAPRAR